MVDGVALVINDAGQLSHAFIFDFDRFIGIIKALEASFELYLEQIVDQIKLISFFILFLSVLIPLNITVKVR